jgi:hypothetical protein
MFKGLTARRLYQSLSIKGLKSLRPSVPAGELLNGFPWILLLESLTTSGASSFLVGSRIEITGITRRHVTIPVLLQRNWPNICDDVKRLKDLCIGMRQSYRFFSGHKWVASDLSVSTNFEGKHSCDQTKNTYRTGISRMDCRTLNVCSLDVAVGCSSITFESAPL